MPGRPRGTKSAGYFAITPTLRQPADERGPRATKTVEKILAATKSILLERGYAGTTVDEIARVAGVSRASFYTYFPSKRDALLALGADAVHAGAVMIEYASQLEAPFDQVQVQRFVQRCFAVLDEQASFAFAWTQAAQVDEEIRSAGMAGHLRICARMGRTLERLRVRPYADHAAAGLALFSQLERAWSYCQLYDRPALQEAVQAEIADQLLTSLKAKGSAAARGRGRRVS